MSDLSRLLRRAGFVAFAVSSLTFRASAAEIAVDQKDLMFVPDTLTISAGDSVRFTDTDRIAHDITVINPDGTSEDKGMDTYTVQIVVPFPKPGVYKITCRIHPAMLMTITVK